MVQEKRTRAPSDSTPVEVERLERFVLDTARDDIAPQEAKARLLASAASIGADTPLSPSMSRVFAGRTARVAGRASLLGAVAIVGFATVSSQVLHPGKDVVDHEPPSRVDVAPSPTEAASPSPAALSTEEPPSPEPSRPAPPTVAAGRTTRRAPVVAKPAAKPSITLPPREAAIHEPSHAGGPTSTLDREIARMTSVRNALGVGDTQGALEGLAGYEAEFPAGTFSMEVSVLRIEALVRAGRGAEARKLGEQFLAQHPQGASARRVTLTLQTAPPIDDSKQRPPSP